MATAGIINGTDLLVYTSSDGGTTYTAITHASSASISFNMDVREASTKDSEGYKESLEGQRSFTVEAEAMTALDAANGFEDIYDLWVARTKIKIKFGTGEAGDRVYTGDAYITSVSVDSGVEDSSSFSVSFEGTGALTTASNPS